MTTSQNNLGDRKIALCYIRVAEVSEEEKVKRREIQQNNILQVCEQHGWIPEWYEDIGGHHSGMSDKNRPAWAALQKRLDDTQVTALVVNDISRLFRNIVLVAQLIEMLEKYGLRLAIAS